jgi:hypothetical protein
MSYLTATDHAKNPFPTPIFSSICGAMGIADLPSEGPVPPQQVAWMRAFKNVKANCDLDSQFGKLDAAIKGHLSLLQKQAACRVKAWLAKLSEEVRNAMRSTDVERHSLASPRRSSLSPSLLLWQTSNAVWKRNRNAHARLLLDQLRAGRLEDPFHVMPPGGPLPTLSKHSAYPYSSSRNGNSPNAGTPSGSQDTGTSGGSFAFDRAGGGATAGPAVARDPPYYPPPTVHSWTVPAATTPGPLSAAGPGGRPATPSQALDDYLGRNGVTPPQQSIGFRGPAREAAHAAAPAAAPTAMESASSAFRGGRLSSVVRGGGEVTLAGTKMRVPSGLSPSTRSVDRHQLADSSWQPSSLELEARLGASRERQAELEWRLRAAEEALQRQAEALAARVSPTAGIGSGGREPRYSPSRAAHAAPKYTSQEIDDLIWRAGSGSTVRAGGGGSADVYVYERRRSTAEPQHAAEDPSEVFAHLEAFKRHTEAVKAKLGLSEAERPHSAGNFGISIGGGGILSGLSSPALSSATVPSLGTTGMPGTTSLGGPLFSGLGPSALIDGSQRLPAREAAARLLHQEQGAREKKEKSNLLEDVRCPIGLPVRHTLKSAAAAECGTGRRAQLAALPGGKSAAAAPAAQPGLENRPLTSTLHFTGARDDLSDRLLSSLRSLGATPRVAASGLDLDVARFRFGSDLSSGFSSPALVCGSSDFGDDGGVAALRQRLRLELTPSSVEEIGIAR